MVTMAALLLPLVASAQSEPCSGLMDVTYDEMTGATVTRMKEYLFLEKDGEPVMALFVAQRRDDQWSESSLTIECRDLGCILNGAVINILYSDGTRDSYLNISTTNCVGFAMLSIDIPDYEGVTIREALLDRKIKRIRVNGTNTFVQADFTSADQQRLQQVLRCLD